MSETKTSPVTAYDAILDIVRAHPNIEALKIVVYQESENWIDATNNLELTTPRLKEAMHQDSCQRRFAEITRSFILEGGLQRTRNQLAANELLGITSKVRTPQERQLHIPMMDFRCPISENNLRALVELLPETGQKHGFVLESGRSYHYYGKELLSRDEWIVFLGKCLLMKDFVDERYVGHQLVDGHCVLRISASSQKPVTPTLASAF